MRHCQKLNNGYSSLVQLKIPRSSHSQSRDSRFVFDHFKMTGSDLYQKSLLLFNSKYYTSAQHLLSLAPESLNSLLLLAECQSRQNDHRSAVQTFDLAISKYKFQPPVQYYEQLYKAKEYRRLLELLLKLENLDLMHNKLMYGCYEHLGNISDAIRIGKSVLRSVSFI